MFSRLQKYLVGVIAIALGIVVSFWFFATQNTQPNSHQIPTEIPNQPTPTAENPETSVTKKEITKLEASISALVSRVETLEKKVATASFSQTTSLTLTAPSDIAFQKQVIYLGSASSHERNWTNTGIEVTLNSDDYPSNVTAVFEAGLSIIGGEAWARLLNTTNGAIINVSEITHNNSTTTWKSSPSFQLYQGNNTYRVQLRSSSGEEVNLSGARLVIDQ